MLTTIPLLLLAACATDGNNNNDQDISSGENTSDTEENNSMDNNLEDASETLDEKRKRIEEKEQELDALRQDIEQKENQLETKAEDLDALQQDSDATEEELQAAENELANMEEELDAKRSELADLETETDEAREREEDGEESANGDSDSEEIQEKADSVVTGLENEDFGTVAAHAHPEKGVRFSPYGNVDPEEDQQFTKEEVRGFMEDEEEYVWGVQDGSGHTIELTPAEYYEEYIYIRDFSRSAQEVNYNEIESRGNTIVNVEDEYPEANFMEYYVSAEEEDLNWAALILAFEEHEDEWYLTAIIVDRWTI